MGYEGWAVIAKTNDRVSLPPALFSQESRICKMRASNQEAAVQKNGNRFYRTILAISKFTFKFGDDEASWGESEGLYFFDHGIHFLFMWHFPLTRSVRRSMGQLAGWLFGRSICRS